MALSSQYIILYDDEFKMAYDQTAFNPDTVYFSVQGLWNILEQDSALELGSV